MAGVPSPAARLPRRPPARQPRRDWQGSGTVSLLGASLYGVELSEWRLPMDLSYSPLDRRGMITVHDSTLQFFVGRATAQASLAWGGDTRLDGQMHFFNVELRHLLRPGSELGHYGSGDLSGTLTFGANSLHSVEDLTANLDAKLRQAQALRVSRAAAASAVPVRQGFLGDCLRQWLRACPAGKQHHPRRAAGPGIAFAALVPARDGDDSR